MSEWRGEAGLLQHGRSVKYPLDGASGRGYQPRVEAGRGLSAQCLGRRARLDVCGREAVEKGASKCQSCTLELRKALEGPQGGAHAAQGLCVFSVADLPAGSFDWASEGRGPKYAAG